MERSTLAAGPGIGVEIVVVRGTSHGPTLSLLGGIHGDEPEGSLAIQVLLAGIVSKDLRGTVRAVPVCNAAAAQAETRLSPLDGLNLAREFPGIPEGLPSQKLAHVLTERAIAGTDMLVDLHSAGRDYVMPFFAGYEANRPWSNISARAAREFGAHLVWEHGSVAPGRTISAASTLGLPSIYVEASGGGSMSGSTIDALIIGVRRVMAGMGMIEPVGAAAAPSGLLRGGDGNVDESLRCAEAGLCVSWVMAGDVVKAEQLIAEIYVGGVVAEEVRAPVAGTVMMLRRKPRVEGGEAIAMLGPTPSAAR